MSRGICGWVLLAALTACGDDDVARDGGPPDAGPPDTGPPVRDAGVDSSCHQPQDATLPPFPDAGPIEPGPELDCGVPSFADGGLRRLPYLQSVLGSSARVAWTTTSGGTGTVRVADGPGGPWTDFPAAAEAFPVTRTLDETEDFVAYDATLDGLEPNRAYCYEVLEDGRPLATGLRLDTAWTGASRPIRILAFGDSGSGSAGQLALRDRFMTHAGEIDLFLHLGDMAYGDGTFGQLHQFFFVPYQDLLHRVPVWPTIGNHEYSTDEGQPYLDVYHLPEVALRDEDRERYYSFDYGNVHFASVDSNPQMLLPIILLGDSMTDDMLDWLRADLAASDAEWKVVFFHHVPYSSSERGINDQVVGTIVPVLEEGGVDLVLAGHDHHYERVVPLIDSCTRPAADTRAITYVTNGAGGAGLRPATGDWFTATVESDVHSFLLLTFHGCVMHAEAVDDMGTVIDDFEVYGCDP